MNPQFPLYIPSKKRSEYMITSRVLTELGVKHFIIVEPQEVKDYLAAVEKFKLLATILELDLSYKNKYELCDKLGLSKSTGPGPARNFAWDHSISLGYSWHWVMDDNIRSFRRLNHNEKVKVSTGSMFKAMEDFVLRYTNIGMAGPNYYMFAPARDKLPAFVMNTRIYSCNLIRNDLPYRWRGRYNEDTILSLDILKAGMCTVQFNAFLQEKMTTQLVAGGNTAEFYAKEGTLPKSRMLVKVHPDVSRIIYRFGRWHHFVDYNPFKKNQLIFKPGVQVKESVDNYGMGLKIKESEEV